MTADLIPYWGFDPMPAGHRLPTKAECIAAAGQALAVAIDELESRDPHEAALAAHRAGGPSVADLEARIRAWQDQRREPPTDTSPPTR